MNNEIENFFNKFLAELAIHSIEGKDIADSCEESDFAKRHKFVSIEMATQFYQDMKQGYEQMELQKLYKQPKKKFLFIEDGSVDTDNLIEELYDTNPEIKVVIYRQGANKPELKELGGE